MNLIAFGCSYTQGCGQEDVYPQPQRYNYTSKYAWPQQLADLLGCSVNNLGEGGASNKQILHTLLNYNFTQDDVVVVCWSHIDRWCIIRENDIEKIGIWNSSIARKSDFWLQYFCEGSLKSSCTETATVFFKYLHNDEDMKQEMHRNILLSKFYLDKKGINNYHMTVGKFYLGKYSWFNTNMLNIDWQKIRKEYGFAKDNHHPGIKANKIVAEKILQQTRGLQERL